MSLGLLAGYGSDSEGEEQELLLPSGESLDAKLRAIAAAAGLQGTGGLTLPTSLTQPRAAAASARKRGAERKVEEEDKPPEAKKALEDMVKEVEALAEKEETLVKNNPAMAEMVDQALSRNTKDLHSQDENDVVIIEDEMETREFYTMRLEHAMPDESHYDPVNQPNRDRFGNMKWRNPPKGTEITGFGEFHGRKDYFFDEIKARPDMWSGGKQSQKF